MQAVYATPLAGVEERGEPDVFHDHSTPAVLDEPDIPPAVAPASKQTDIPEAAVLVSKPADVPEAAVLVAATAPIAPENHNRSLEEIIAEASEPMPEPEKPIEAQDAVRPAQPPSEFERLVLLAQQAAASRDLPLFNTYSRLAIDHQPTDPRMYALRAELTEEADGFARASWSSIGWSLLTPRRKTALIAQHLYNFNTALKYSKVSQQHDLISRLAWQLIRQAIDLFTEQGELRCQSRLFFKTFKGHFSRRDLISSYYLLDALRLINRQTCPYGHAELLDALRAEIRKAPPRIAKRLYRL